MNKIVVCGAILSLVLWACDDSVSNPALSSVGSGNSVPASSATISSSSESSASVNPTSEKASSTVADEQESSSSITQKSSSSRGSLFSSSSMIYDPNYGVCCTDTLYIENGDSTYHQPKPGCVPYPPSIMTYQCVPPVVVNKDSLKALSSSSSSVMVDPRAKCIAATDILSKGYSKYLKKFFLHESKKGDCQIEIPFAKDLCEVDADISFKRSGDTLSVEYANVRSETTCTCLYNHKFDIPAEYKDVKYFILNDVVYEFSPDEVSWLYY